MHLKSNGNLQESIKKHKSTCTCNGKSIVINKSMKLMKVSRHDMKTTMNVIKKTNTFHETNR